jgi:hypothetical protein
MERSADSSWLQAMSLQSRQQELDRSPGDSGISRRGLVEEARKSGVLLSSASYIVVENQAQWRMLETGERQKLGQNQALEFVETPAPPALWGVIGFFGWLFLRRWRQMKIDYWRPRAGFSRIASLYCSVASAVRPSARRVMANRR